MRCADLPTTELASLNRRRRHIVAGAGLAFALLYGCSSHYPAPVSEPPSSAAKSAPRPAAGAKPAAPSSGAAKPAVSPPSVTADTGDDRPDYYTVKPGDTLYAIALDHGLSYRDIAEWNRISNPNSLRAGQQLRLRAPDAVATSVTPLRTVPRAEARPLPDSAQAIPPAASVPRASEAFKPLSRAVKVPYTDQAYAQLSGQAQAPAAAAVAAPKPEVRAEERPAAVAEDDKVDWGWPVGGKLANTFNEAANFKGIGISGKLGQPVAASAPGRVLYSGDGIRGYGKLIIIRHNKEYLSVYAHNSQLLVKEGQNVLKGQKIAEMGDSDAQEVALHFEIRRFGKPVDPVKLLPPA